MTSSTEATHHSKFLLSRTIRRVSIFCTQVSFPHLPSLPYIYLSGGRVTIRSHMGYIGPGTNRHSSHLHVACIHSSLSILRLSTHPTLKSQSSLWVEYMVFHKSRSFIKQQAWWRNGIASDFGSPISQSLKIAGSNPVWVVSFALWGCIIFIFLCHRGPIHDG